MTRRQPLPPHLRGVAVKTFDPDHGVPRSRLRAKDVDHPFHGVSAEGLDLTSLWARCSALLPALSDGFCFSHTTAALLYGIPLPARVANGPHLHVATLASTVQKRMRGVIDHRLTAGQVDVVMLRGLPVVSAADTWFHLATSLRKADLVAAGDYLITRPLHHDRIARGQERRGTAPCRIEDLVEARHRHAGRRGIRSAVWALEQLRAPVDSRPESLLRMLLVSAGFPEPVVNDPTPVDGGGVVLHPDLKWERWRILLEFEGDGHRERTRFRADIKRKERFEAAGWRVIRVVWDDLTVDVGAFLARVARTIQQQQARGFA